MKKIVLVTAAAAVAVSGGTAVAAAATTGGRAASAVSAVTGVKWGECAGSLKGQAECAQVQVPLDHRKPNGRKISIAVSRVKATDRKNYQGVLLVNPGGPGGSGLAYSAGLKRWLTGVGHGAVAAKYDIIGFDPRGVGSSKPALSCDPNFQNPIRPDYVPSSRKEEEAWKAKSRAYARACAQKFGWLLPHMRTTDVARDVDAIRAALGQKKINYYGFSYGTYLGATYATLFPQRVRRMVWDGNVNPKTVWYDAQLEQDKAFERNIKLWFAWVAKYDSLYKLGKTGKAVEAKYYALRAAAKKSPIGGKIGPSELDDIVLNAGYNTGYYIPFAQALSAWANKKDPAALLEFLNPGGDDNGFAVYNAVQAADARWPRNWKVWHNDAVKLYKQGYRFNTWSNVWFNAPVAYWPFQGGPALKLGAKKLPGLLLVQSTLDAATPVAGGYEMHKTFPSSRLVAELGGKTHSNTLNGNKCLDDKVAAYLDSGRLPAGRRGADALCKAVPALNDPNPTAVKSASAKAGKDLPVGRP
ncbi:alpha/beta hydrolase [Actinomadura kijaniata]|uniref:Pimeloyl-ACP methyl ester carboxylesterase n=1 Tax=Actinomadura namibiensis TaxID=182080 RepID=A0A7W3QJG7_ACTNM|nr:alpha/beta hydrolase [Actinomadura namibiensis]MBA8949454.1 pimeloyl-ACP methyl ester carboxylesterase [Actinomadura namibiensis]